MEELNNIPIPLTEEQIEFAMEQELKKKVLEESEKRNQAYEVKEVVKDGHTTYSINFNKFRSVEEAEEYLTESERNEYAQKNENLIKYMANKYLVQNSKIDFDELISVASLGFVKALNAYKKTYKFTFSTFACKCMENELIDLYRSEKKRSGDISIDEEISSSSSGNTKDAPVFLKDSISSNENIEENYEISEEKRILYEHIEKYLTQKEQYIIKAYYGLDDFEKKNQVELSRLFNVSQAYINKQIKAAEEKLRKTLKAIM